MVSGEIWAMEKWYYSMTKRKAKSLTLLITTTQLLEISSRLSFRNLSRKGLAESVRGTSIAMLMATICLARINPWIAAVS